TDGDGSHGSTSKTPSYTKSVSWHHYRQLDTWLSEKLGEKRLRGLENIFRKDGFDTRSRARSRSTVKTILQEDRQKLACIIEKINS
ncbi:hypothetical protein, partial [Enterobacter kobei]|uniref:hypothetical protein n=1 Tax=Enterobacter kobei TaxID=208224 RepID=UPI0039C930C5